MVCGVSGGVLGAVSGGVVGGVVGSLATLVGVSYCNVSIETTCLPRQSVVQIWW